MKNVESSQRLSGLMTLQPGTSELEEDIHWLHSVEEGLVLAAQKQKPLVLKPLGQGMGHNDEW
jgi:hypothetical protein